MPITPVRAMPRSTSMPKIEQPRDDIGGAVLLEGGFRMGVQIMPPGGHVGLEIGYAVNYWHRLLLCPTFAGFRVALSPELSL